MDSEICAEHMCEGDGTVEDSATADALGKEKYGVAQILIQNIPRPVGSVCGAEKAAGYYREATWAS